MKPHLDNPETRPFHFNLVRNYFTSFTWDTHQPVSNAPYDLGTSPPDFKAVWDLILGYMVSATVKDFTVMVRVVEAVAGTVDVGAPKVHQEQVMRYGGKDYRVRVGVIDLETKMYTKIPIYIKEVEEAYLNFVKFYN